MDNQLTRRSILLSGGMALLAGSVPAFGVEHNPSFLVLGDWGRGSTGQRKVATALASVAEQIKPRFVISVGDNFYGKGVKSVADALWRTRFEDIYDAPDLRCPWYPVLGNHDRKGNVEAQIQFSTIDPRWRMQARYYQRSEAVSDRVNADFFFLDTTTIVEPSGDNKQLAWLKGELAASRADWKITVGHHPVFSGGRHGSNRVLIQQLKPLFDRFGVRAYFNGHDHDLQHVVVDDVHYLTCGSGADVRPTSEIGGTVFSASQQGFLACMLGPDKLAIAFINDGGNIIYKASIPIAPPLYP